MMKNRKRVEGRETKNPNRVGAQRLRQRIRGYWDRRNLERRKGQRKYRKKGKRRGRSGEGEKEERTWTLTTMGLEGLSMVTMKSWFHYGKEEDKMMKKRERKGKDEKRKGKEEKKERKG